MIELIDKQKERKKERFFWKKSVINHFCISNLALADQKEQIGGSRKK